MGITVVCVIFWYAIGYTLENSRLEAQSHPKMEVDGSDDFPDFNWVIFRFQPLIYWGCAHPEANSSAPEKGVF